MHEVKFKMIRDDGCLLLCDLSLKILN